MHNTHVSNKQVSQFGCLIGFLQNSFIVAKKRYWNRIKVNENYLVDALYEWSSRRAENVRPSIGHLIDTCNWPNCNKACPNPTDPLNDNKEADVLELFSSYGLVSETDLARQLKIDVNNIKNYKYEDLMGRLVSNSH